MRSLSTLPQPIAIGTADTAFSTAMFADVSTWRSLARTCPAQFDLVIYSDTNSVLTNAQLLGRVTLPDGVTERWMIVDGAIGLDADGVVDFSPGGATQYRQTFSHSPRVSKYALVGNVGGSGSPSITAEVVARISI